MTLKDRIWPLGERLFWGRVGPLLGLGSAAWAAACAASGHFWGWTWAYGILTVIFAGLTVWGQRG